VIERVPFYPLLLVLLPVGMVYLTNGDEVRAGAIWVMVGVFALAVAALLAGLSRAIGPHRAAVAVCAMGLVFWSPQPQIALVLLMGALMLLVSRLGDELRVLTTFANLFSLGLWVFVLLSRLRVGEAVGPRPGYREALDGAVPRQAVHGTPDVWWILLDGHGREDVLAEKYGVSTGFADFLRSRGFVVADQARSNYAQTAFSVASTLNLEPVEALLVPGTDRRMAVGQLARENRVVRLFRERGYRVVAHRSDYSLTEIGDPDVRRGPLLRFDEIESYVYGHTAVPAISRWWTGQQGFIPRAIRRHSLDRTLANLAEGDDDDGPTLVLAHLVAPHPPFVFDRDGAARRSDEAVQFADGSHWDRENGQIGMDYHQGYAGQVTWLDGRMRGVIDGILAKDPDAVILVQGDHGPGGDLSWESMDETDLTERLSILSAYRLPGGEDRVTPSITPVNSFRVVLNELFGADLPMLPDRSWWQPWSRPFDTVDVTDQLR
jgi:Sulfatase